jgi:hypothetical protein
MNATLLLADYARVSDDKLDLLGAGWSITGPGPAQIGIGILLAVPWDQTNVKHHVTLNLLDADGHSVTEPETDEPLFHFEGDFEVGRPAGMKPGTPQPGVLAVNLNGIPIPAGGRYEFRLVIDGDQDTAVSAPFSTRHDSPPTLAA